MGKLQNYVHCKECYLDKLANCSKIHSKSNLTFDYSFWHNTNNNFHLIFLSLQKLITKCKKKKKLITFRLFLVTDAESVWRSWHQQTSLSNERTRKKKKKKKLSMGV